MNLKNWEATIQQFLDESKIVPTETAKHRVLTAWRAKLEKEPNSLEPYQIDAIVREVRARLNQPVASASS